MTFQQMISLVEASLRTAGDLPDPETAMAVALVRDRRSVPGVTVTELAHAISSERLPVLGQASALHAIAVGLADRNLLPEGQVAA